MKSVEKKRLFVVIPSALKMGFLQKCAAADRAGIQDISFSLNIVQMSVVHTYSGST